jgi:hypothetical protein
MRYVVGLVVFGLGITVGVGSHVDLYSIRPVYTVVGVTVGSALLAGGRRLPESLRSVLQRQAELPELKIAFRALHAARIGAIAGGFLVSSFGFVLAMKFFDSPEAMKNSLLLTAQGLMCGLVIAYGAVMPLETRVQRRLLRAGERTEFSELGMDLFIFSSGFVFAGLVLAFYNYQF